MKDLLEKIIRYIPGYILDFVSFISGPKEFLRKKIADEDIEFEKSFIFIGISFSLEFLLSWFRLSAQHDFWKIFAFGLIGSIFKYLLLAIAMVITWKIIRVQLSFRSILLILNYLDGVTRLIWAVMYSFGMLLIKTLSDGVYHILLMTDQYFLLFGLKKIFAAVINSREFIDPETGQLILLILFITITISALFTILVYSISWKIFSRISTISPAKLITAFVIFYFARFLITGAT